MYLSITYDYHLHPVFFSAISLTKFLLDLTRSKSYGVLIYYRMYTSIFINLRLNNLLQIVASMSILQNQPKLKNSCKGLGYFWYDQSSDVCSCQNCITYLYTYLSCIEYLLQCFAVRACAVVRAQPSRPLLRALRPPLHAAGTRRGRCSPGSNAPASRPTGSATWQHAIGQRLVIN